MSELENNLDDDNIEDLMKMLDQLTSESDGDLDYNKIFDTLGLDVGELEREMEEYIPKVDLVYTESNENVTKPKYAYESDSGFDLHSTEEMYIEPFGRILIPTGLHFDIPDGYEIQVRSKSGLALNQGLMVLNSPGTVDQGYNGEIKVIMFNTTKVTIKIEKGQKIAQAVLCPVVSGKWVNLVETNKINNKDRNENGFGSTGI
jgi:dUTP pyrophosphatase